MPKKVQHIQPASLRNANKLTVYAYSYHADIEICYPSKLEFELNAWLLNCDDQDEEGRSEILKAELFKSKGLSWPQVETRRFQFKFNDRWQLIADMDAHTEVTATDWHGIRMPIPRLTYESGTYNISTIYMPSIQGYNLNATMGIYLTITL